MVSRTKGHSVASSVDSPASPPASIPASPRRAASRAPSPVSGSAYTALLSRATPSSSISFYPSHEDALAAQPPALRPLASIIDVKGQFVAHYPDVPGQDVPALVAFERSRSPLRYFAYKSGGSTYLYLRERG